MITILKDRTGQDRTGQDRTGQDRTGLTFSKLFLFVFLFALFAMPAWANDNQNEDGTETKPYTFSNWGELNNALSGADNAKKRTDVTESAENPTFFKLTQDITAGGADALTVPSGRYVTLDLAGYKIDRGLTSATENGNVIKVYGNLTLKDSSGNDSGKITGGNNASYDDYGGGGVVVYGNGTFTMTGGSITGNNADVVGGGADVYGGGVYVDSGGTFTMTGGSITDNTTPQDASGSGVYVRGGGVYVDSGGTFTMTGGSITDNNANDGDGVFVDGTFTMTGGSITGNNADVVGGGVFVGHGGTFTMTGGSITGNNADGGGVYVYDGGTFTMTGGSITGNNAYNGGGVYVYGGGKFNVSGKPVIKDNVRGGTLNNGVYVNGTANNVYFYDNSVLVTVTGKLTDGAEIYVSRAQGVSVAQAGKDKDGNTYTITTTDAAAFRSDTDNTLVGGLNYEKDGVFVYICKPVEITLPNETTFTYTGAAQKPNITVKDGDNTLTEGTDYTVVYLNENGDVVDFKDAGKYTVAVTGTKYTGKKGTLTIEKADPSYTVPTGLKATVGQTLADVKFEVVVGGKWVWQDAPATSVGSAGKNTFKATFTPTDTKNYNVVKDVAVSVTVTAKPADPDNGNNNGGNTTPTPKPNPGGGSGDDDPTPVVTPTPSPAPNPTPEPEPTPDPDPEMPSEPEAEPENVSNPTPESLVPDMTDEQKSEAAGMAADALKESGNGEAAEEFRNTTPATADETKEAITQATPEEAQQAANNATEEMASQGREVRGEPVAIGTVVFEETRLVFLAIILPDSMQVGDLLTFFKNEQVSGNAVSLAAESSGAVVFLDSAGKETKVVPEDRKVTMATVFEGGKTYQPVIVATKAEEAETKESGSASSNSGCDAGFGAAGLSSIVLAAALATRRMR